MGQHERRARSILNWRCRQFRERGGGVNFCSYGAASDCGRKYLVVTADGLNRWQNGHVTVYGKPRGPGQNRRTDQREPITNSGQSKSRTADFKAPFIRWGRRIGQDRAGTSEGAFYFDRGRFEQVPGVPGGIYLQSPGMDTGRFGSAASTRGFSIRRHRVPFSVFLGANSDTRMGR